MQENKSKEMLKLKLLFIITFKHDYIDSTETKQALKLLHTNTFILDHEITKDRTKIDDDKKWWWYDTRAPPPSLEHAKGGAHTRVLKFSSSVMVLVK